VILLSIIASLLFLVSTIFFSFLSVVAALVDRSGRAYLWVGRTWSKSGMFFFGSQVKVIGAEHIKAGQNYVYAANHSSYIDILILLGYIPDNLRLTLRSSLTRIPIWGWALLVGPFITIDRSNPQKAEKSIRIAIERIRSGASVLFFPEGTRTPDGKMQPFKRGAFHLAKESGAPILPVAVIGSYQILSRHEWLPRWGRRATIKIGEPIYPKNVPPSESRAEEIRLMRETEMRVREMLS
jgi:1-acyl-sn-glycerol-3-phosphate acyltransferase